MNRIEATNNIGKVVIIDEKSKGKYFGELLDVIAIPKKPWRGLVKIKGVLSFPKQNWEDGISNLNLPIYERDEVVELAGSKIHEMEKEQIPNSYEQSIVQSVTQLVKQHDDIFNNNDEALLELQAIVKKQFPQLTIKLVDKKKPLDHRYLYYTVKQVDAKPILVNENEPELPLTDCPFEFELQINDQWIPGHYTENWLFAGHNGKKYLIRENDSLRLAKKHLEPYQLLLNELEKPALQSLEKSLQNFQLSHKHLVHCHNELLLQLLNAVNEKNFSGVNFMFYQKGRTHITVQHHYERELVDNGSDIIYDRFEVTSSTGKRYIVTYTNEFSRGK